MLLTLDKQDNVMLRIQWLGEGTFITLDTRLFNKDAEINRELQVILDIRFSRHSSGRMVTLSLLHIDQCLCVAAGTPVFSATMALNSLKVRS